MVSTLIKYYKNPLSWLYLVLVFLAVIAQYISPRFLVDTREYLDAYFWYFQSESIKIDPYQGEHWMFPVRRTPLFPLILFVMKIKPWTLLQGLISISIPALLLKFLKIQPYSAKETMYWFAWLSFPLQFFYAALPMPEMLAQAGMLLFMIFLYQGSVLKMFGIITLLICLKPIFIVLLIPVSFRLFYLNTFKSKGKYALGFILPIGAMLMMSMVNKIHWNYWGISSIATTNAYHYNRYVLLKKAKGQDGVDSIYNAESKQLNNLSNLDLKKGQIMNAWVKKSLIDYPWQYLYLHLKGALTMFFDPGRYDAMVFLKWEKTSGFLKVKDEITSNNQHKRPIYEWVYILVFAFLNSIKFLFLVAALTKFIRNYRVYPLEYGLICLAIFLYAMAIGPVGTARYLVPLYPCLIGVVFLTKENVNAKIMKYSLGLKRNR